MSTLLPGRSDAATGGGANLIIGGGRYRDSDTNKVHYLISINDLNEKTTQRVALDFFPHGIHQRPDIPHRLAIFEKKGPGSCEFDLRERKVVRTLTTDPTRHFYGHGCYSSDSSLLYCTESYLDTFDGIIAIRDSKTMEFLGEFPTYGKEPHECKFIDHGRTMVISNGGGNLRGAPPSVTYVDVASQKLLETVEPTNSALNTGHFAIDADGGLVIISAPRSGLGPTGLGGVSIRPRGEDVLSLAQPSAITGRMQGEALSVVIHQGKRIAAVTHPDGNMITFWSMTSRQLISSLDIPGPRGVTLSSDEKHFIVSYGPQAMLMSVALDTLEPIADSRIQGTYLTGSHIYNWSRVMTEMLYPGPVG
jgi:hypothetical protein